MVFESAMLFETVPGPAIELRERVAEGIAESRRCRGLGKGRRVEPLIQRAAAGGGRDARHTLGRSVPAVPQATSGLAAL